MPLVPGTMSLSPSWVCAQNKSRAYHPVFLSFKILEVDRAMVWTDATMTPFNAISIRSTPEIVISSKRNHNKAMMKRGLCWMTKYKE